MDSYYEVFEEFVKGLFRDGHLSDDLSTRFEVWARLNTLEAKLNDLIRFEIESEAEAIADNMDMDESEEIARSLRDFVDELEESLKKRRVSKRDIRQAIAGIREQVRRHP